MIMCNSHASLLTLFVLICWFYIFRSLLNVPTTASSKLRCKPDQSSALLQFKQELTIQNPKFRDDDSTTYSLYLKMKTWKEGSDCCFWDGVKCDMATGLVVGLNISRSSLQGPLSSNSSLLRLTRLIELDLSFNDFDLSLVPSELGRLSSLSYLNLASTNISGIIPSSFWNLSQLTYLDLSFNNLYGRLPSALGNLRKLSVLDLSACQLSGEVPPSIGNLTLLKRLLLPGNSFTGQILSSLRKLNHLNSLDVSDNNFHGALPPSLFMMPFLISLWLDNNKFTSIPHVDIHNVSSSRLKVLSLSGNKLSQQISKPITKLKSLILLDLHSTNLTGILELGNFSELWYLDLSDNILLSEVKANISSSPIPPLEFLYMSSCNITRFPEFLKDQHNIEQLNLSHNKITGHLLKWLGTIGTEPLSYIDRSHLKLLDLSHNKLSGKVPNGMGNLRSLVALNLASNKFIGPIPSSFGELSEVVSLDLSSNMFSEEIPQQLTNLKVLAHLNLSVNQLTGQITQGGKIGTFPSSSFEGNPRLCGFPLLNMC